jgi:diaminopimelate decarboxylase
MTAPIAIRVNPDVDARTHAKITTGLAENKFGIPADRAREIYAEAAHLPGLKVAGVATHIGSQITELTPFDVAYQRLADIAAMLRADGHALTHVDVGGGLGIPYRLEASESPEPAAYAAIVAARLGALGLKVVLEPGRFIVGNAGVLVSEAVYIKQGAAKTFVILDAGMNDLIRPTLYDAHHDILPVRQPDPKASAILADVVGGVCETGDFLALGRRLPPLTAGDLVAIMTAGAYGAVQGSTYNTRRLAAEVLVKDGDWAVVRPRQSFDALIGMDRIPPWLG